MYLITVAEGSFYFTRLLGEGVDVNWLSLFCR